MNICVREKETHGVHLSYPKEKIYSINYKRRLRNIKAKNHDWRRLVYTTSFYKDNHL